MKTILIPIASGFAARNTLRSGVVEQLVQQGVRVVITIPMVVADEFKKECESLEGVMVEGYPPAGLLERKLITLRYLETFFSPTTFSLDTETIRSKRKKMRIERPLLFFLYRAANAVSRSPLVAALLREVDWWIHKKTWYRELFARYHPALLFSTDIFHLDEIPFLEAAKRFRVPIVASILSWDNFTSYGRLPVLPEKVLVWNEVMKREAVELHRCASSNVMVVGNPNFDLYKKLHFPPRGVFVKRLGGDPQKKVITYAAIPSAWCDTEPEIIQMIVAAMRAGEFDVPVQLVIRPHPKDSPSRYAVFGNQPDIMVQASWRQVEAFRDNWNPSLEDVIDLGALLCASDVVVNIASTVSIEAALFDRPIVNPRFDGREPKPYLQSVARIYDFTHYRNVVSTGGVRMAGNERELIEAIRWCLHHPEAGREGRQRLVAQQCGPCDGKASERIAQALFSLL